MPRIERQVTVQNKMGLHARPSTQIANTAGEFSADVRLEKDGLAVDGKSVLELLMLAAEKGSQLQIIAEGDDAQAAVDALVHLVENRFGELDVDSE